MACYPFWTLPYNFKPFWTLCFFLFGCRKTLRLLEQIVAEQGCTYQFRWQRNSFGIAIRMYIGMCRNTRSFLKRVELNDPGRNVSSSLLTFCQALPEASGGDKSRTGWEMSAGGTGQADPISVCEAIDQTGGFKIFSFFQLSNSSFKNYYSHMLSVKWVGIPPIQQLFV